MRHLRFLHIKTILTVICMLAFSCTSDPKPKPDPKPDNEGNVWIYEQMSTHYLYNEHVKQLSPNYDLEHQAFYESLLYNGNDGLDGKHPDRFGNNYYYSSFESSSKTKSIGVHVTSYGIEYARYQASSDRYVIRVLYVAKNSVAEKQNITRGLWITEINGNPITSSNYHELDSGNGVTLTVGEGTLSSNYTVNWAPNNPELIMLPAATIVENSPVYHAEVIEANGIKIGYLVYNAFETGPNGYYDKAFNRELQQVFREFKAEGVTEMVVDLRYNPGGYVDCCILLGSMIAPSETLGETFAISRYNDALHEARGEVVDKFLAASSVGDTNLNLSTLYVLTTRYSASASELLINCLRPYMSVYIIGDQTEGKNVSAYALSASTAFGFSITPITARIYNKNHESDYSKGFKPDVSWDELTRERSMLYELGDPKEALLSRALNLITGRRSAATDSKATDVINLKVSSSISRRNTPGVLVVPNEW